MKRRFLVLFLPLLLSFGCRQKQPVDYVNPFVGTGFHGQTYPGATMPFGAVQLSPDTRRGNWDACSGYHYSDSTLLGFSHTHLSGTGCIDLGDILFHPTTGNIQKRASGYIFDPIPFSHSEETSSPGYYSVRLGNGIFAELTATERVGVHRYTFSGKGESKIIIDLAHALDNEVIKEAELHYKPGEISGMRCTKGWVDNQYIFFVAQFSESFSSAGFISNGKTLSANELFKGNDIQAVLSFGTNFRKLVIVKVGLSLVSIENARMNLEKEVPDFNFDRVKNEARQKWNEVLSAFKLTGETSELTNFYSAAYHTMVTPNLISDVNGDYRGADQKIHNSKRKNVYSTFSLWDTFRAWNPLMTLVDTTLVNDMINSFLNFYDQTGELPIWPLSSGETGTMIGYHSASVIYDAYSKNIRGYDIEKAFEAMKVSADKNSKSTTPFENLGYIPSDTKKESVSCLLENSYDDWCIAQMAKSLGHSVDYDRFIRRSQFYKNVFDGSTGFFRSRLRDGIWESPFNPFEVGRAFTEATAWQYRFFVPHDVNGMINMLGGEKKFTDGLDSLFSTSSATKGTQSDITGLIGQYAHGNEPSHHMAYLYNFAGQPWKSQQMVRKLLKEMYLPTPEGIIGNEDCGQMSAWYVLSSLGLYPVCPGSSQFVLSSPLFEKAIVRLANGKELIITSNDPVRNTYINEVYWNDKPVTENYINYSQLMNGGSLRFVLDSKPNLKRGISSQSYPYSLSEKDEVSIPFISTDISFFEKEVTVSCGNATAGAEIHYTIDGTEPTEKCLLYNSPFTLTKSEEIRLKAFKSGFSPSVTAVYNATKAEFRQPVQIKPEKKGVAFQYFEGLFSKTSDIIPKGKLVKTGQCELPTLTVARIPDHFGVIFTGYLFAPVDGVYTFSTYSDDGSLLSIGEKTVVDNDGSHSDMRAVGRIALRKGYHPYKLLYFQDYEDQHLSLNWIIPGIPKEEPIASKYLFVK
jgi:predicted alpha-1,2-mannosidase